MSLSHTLTSNDISLIEKDCPGVRLVERSFIRPRSCYPDAKNFSEDNRHYFEYTRQTPSYFHIEELLKQGLSSDVPNQNTKKELFLGLNYPSNSPTPAYSAFILELFQQSLGLLDETRIHYNLESFFTTEALQKGQITPIPDLFIYPFKVSYSSSISHIRHLFQTLKEIRRLKHSILSNISYSTKLLICKNFLELNTIETVRQKCLESYFNRNQKTYNSLNYLAPNRFLENYLRNYEHLFVPQYSNLYSRLDSRERKIGLGHIITLGLDMNYESNGYDFPYNSAASIIINQNQIRWDLELHSNFSIKKEPRKQIVNIEIWGAAVVEIVQKKNHMFLPNCYDEVPIEIIKQGEGLGRHIDVD